MKREPLRRRCSRAASAIAGGGRIRSFTAVTGCARGVHGLRSSGTSVGGRRLRLDRIDTIFRIMAKIKLSEMVKAERNSVHEVLQLWGSFPDCSPKHSCELDWIHVLLSQTTDLIEHVRLLSAPDYNEVKERKLMRKRLAQIIATCEAWDRQL